MPAQDLLRRVSIASGGVVLRRVADAVLGRAMLPPIDETLARLGVRPTPDGSVELDAHAPDAWIREAITAPVIASASLPAHQLEAAPRRLHHMHLQ
jgi:hypothetical protein